MKKALLILALFFVAGLAIASTFGGGGGGDKVSKSGDTMTGDLTTTGVTASTVTATSRLNIASPTGGLYISSNSTGGSYFRQWLGSDNYFNMQMYGTGLQWKINSQPYFADGLNVQNNKILGFGNSNNMIMGWASDAYGLQICTSSTLGSNIKMNINTASTTVRNNLVVASPGYMTYNSNTSGANLSYDGRTIAVTAREAITAFQVIYTTSTQYSLAISSDILKCTGMVGIAANSAAAGGAVTMIYSPSVIRNDSWNWTAGQPIYISTWTAGGMTQTKPTQSNVVIRLLGYAISQTIIMFDASKEWLELL